MRDIQDYTDKYIDEPFEDTMVTIRKRIVISQCNQYVHRNILEIGCGTNPFFLDFHDYDQMVIVEPGAAFAERAEKLAAKEKKPIQIIPGFLEEAVEAVKASGIAFDFVILSSVLHELDEPQKMLRAIGSLCNQRTVVHINVPNATSLHRLIAIEAGMIEDVHAKSTQMKTMQRRRVYDMESLKQEIMDADFTTLDSGTYFIKPFTHAQMQRCLDEGIIDEKVLMGLEKLTKYIPAFGAGIYVNAKCNSKEL